jgi:FkbM family methyltransferase
MSLRRRINSLLQNTSYQVTKTNPALNNDKTKNISVNIEHFLAKQLLTNEDFFFVQIGANDGIRADDSHAFITEHKLKGIVVEPLRDLFQSLTESYASHPQITKINKAIHSSASEMPLYRIKSDANVPDWCHGIASFNKTHLLNFAKKVPKIEQYIIEEKVECIPLNTLFEQSNVKQISFLQIDTEGYDFEIIKMIDFKKFKPKIIRYECCNLSENDHQKCIELLADQGYAFFAERNDMIAVIE